MSDLASRPVLKRLAADGTQMLALRSAGFNHIDLDAAAELGIIVARVSAYSPHAVAEFTVGMIPGPKPEIPPRAHSRLREANFSLEGTGKIGHVVDQILHGFGCEVVAHDPQPNDGTRSLGVRYLEFQDLLALFDIVTLQCPLTPKTHHLINRRRCNSCDQVSC